jgi:hypothetical protein
MYKTAAQEPTQQQQEELLAKLQLGAHFVLGVSACHVHMYGCVFCSSQAVTM